MNRMNPAVAFLIALGLPVQHGVQNAIDHIVNVDQGQFVSRVTDLNGQPPGNVMAEGGDHAVVVGATPFAEYPLHAENINRGPQRVSVGKNGIFRLLFAFAIVIIQGGLDAAGHQNGRFVAALCQQLQHCVG